MNNDNVRIRAPVVVVANMDNCGSSHLETVLKHSGTWDGRKSLQIRAEISYFLRAISANVSNVLDYTVIQ